MKNHCKLQEDSFGGTLGKVFCAPLVASLSALAVVLIYVGYACYFLTSEEAGAFAYLTDISFELFVASQFGMIFLSALIKIRTDSFLARHPSIPDQKSLDSLKPVARANMYLALIHLLLLGFGSLMAIMSILNHGGMTSIAVVVFTLVAAQVTSWGSLSEARLRRVECTDASLQEELGEIFHCWQHRPFPNF